MSDTTVSEQDSSGISRAEMMSALFAQLIMQQSNMAMLLLGKVPHPQTGETMRDVEAARLFIDQLEMLRVKTKGNLSKEEEQLLKQSLMSLQMAFVETMESPAPEEKQPEAAAPAAEKKSETPPETATDEESKKKFTKKY
jgi:cell envelope opacity-associated protein A